MNKGDLLRTYLEDQGVRLHPGRSGWQKISCIGPAHARGDRDPSASINLTLGKYHCFACDLRGDAYDLVQKLEGVDFPRACAILGGDPVVANEDEPVWL